MNYLKDNPKGVDKAIQNLQTYLYDSLVEKYCFRYFDCYGRIYKNKKDGMIIPEWYLGDKEYKEVLLDDNQDGIMFFVPSDTYSSESNYTLRDYDLIVSVDLESIDDSQTRDDEEFRNTIIILLDSFKNDVAYDVVVGLENVYRGFTGVHQYFEDMQPYHHFKITGKINYHINNC